MKSPVVRAMTRLGMLRVTLVMTITSAFMSLACAWLLSFFLDVGDFAIYARLAFVIPFFVTPVFSYLTALSMRESRRARQVAFEMARCDPLTGISNRRAFFEAGDKGRRAREDGRALLFLDVDHFKKVNDTFGHEGGDAVLVHLASVLTDNTRADDIVARFGGEEFVILLPHCGASGAHSLAERIMREVRRSVVAFSGRPIRFTVSIGIAVASPETGLEQLIADADAQLYRAKEDGRNLIRLAPALAEALPDRAATVIRAA